MNVRRFKFAVTIREGDENDKGKGPAVGTQLTFDVHQSDLDRFAPYTKAQLEFMRPILEAGVKKIAQDAIARPEQIVDKMLGQLATDFAATNDRGKVS